MSEEKTETDAEFDARYEAYFNRKDIDGWEIRKAFQAWLPDGYSQIFFRLHVFGPSGFWTTHSIRYKGQLIWDTYWL